jgi:predicted dehydrogenase
VIDVLLIRKLGLIGFGIHAKRLLRIIEQNTNFEISQIFHPTKNLDDFRSTTNIDDLYDLDGVIIASPNSTHYEYILKLIENSKCLIFCEKPPCVSTHEINQLQQLSDDDKKRIFFDFNFRFSQISKLIKNIIDSENFGKITHIKIISAHGLSFKPDYLNSWRSTKNNLHNILETVTIHFIDLMNYHFGNPVKSIYIPSKFSEQGESYDTCNVLLEYPDQLTCSIFNSYASPYTEDFSIVCTDGYITFRDDQISEFYPRDTFDSQGNFITPPVQNETPLNMDFNYKNSLNNSVNDFLSHIEKKSFFDLSDFELSLMTNLQVLNMKKTS